MRILLIDIDSLRPDHLGCYGYSRSTSPNIDRVAAEGMRLNNCYASDAPCLPSRTALITCMPGIHSGVVNHGGTAAEPLRVGIERGFSSMNDRLTLFECFDRAGWHTAAITPFPARHAAWHFMAGLRESYNPGRFGSETADQINQAVLPWLRTRARKDNWFLYVNYWDAHRPYRTPESFGDPFRNDPVPAWHTEEIRRAHWQGVGLQCAHDPNDGTGVSKWPRMPGEISSSEAYKQWIDGYDTGINYADAHIGKLFEVLQDEGVWDDTAIIITADHGENQGELNYYGAHRTGDHITHRVPLIIRWLGLTSSQREWDGLCYQFDLGATLLDLRDIEKPVRWQGISFREALSGRACGGRDSLVFGQLACMAQRSARFGDWIVMRTWHDGFSLFPEVMAYNLRTDPHELHDLAPKHPDIVKEGLARLETWQQEMLRTQPGSHGFDPLETVLREGPLHASPENLRNYCKRLRETGRSQQAGLLEKLQGRPAEYVRGG